MLNLQMAKAHFEALKADRSNYDDLTEEVAHYVMPERMDITSDYQPTVERMEPTFDSTGVVALHTLASFLQGSIFNPSDAWLRLTVPGRKVTHDERVALDEAAMAILSELDDSNFYQQAHMCLRDGAGIGNACLTMEERPARLRADGTLFGGVDFEAAPFNRVWRRLDRMGRTITLARKYDLHPIEAEEFFGKKVDDNDGKDVCCFSLVERMPNGRSTIYWWKKGAEDFLIPPAELDYRTAFPFMWDRTDGATYGYGIGNQVRPVLAGLSELSRETIQAVGRDLNPPLTVESDSFASTSVANNGLLALKRGITRDPSFLRSGSDFAAADALRRLDQQVVERAFFIDALLGPPTQERSAAAVQMRRGLVATRMAGPAQNISIFLSEVVGGLIGLMAARGALPTLEGIGGVKPVFVSPFFVDAKSAIVDRVTGFVAQQAQIAALLQDKAVMNRIELNRFAQTIADLSDVPANILRSDEELAAVEARDAEVAAEQRTAALGQQAPLNTELQLGDRNLPGIGGA